MTKHRSAGCAALVVFLAVAFHASGLAAPLPASRARIAAVNTPDVIPHPAPHGQVSPSVAIDPNDPNVVLVASSVSGPTTALVQPGAYWSLDGGATWAGSDSVGWHLTEHSQSGASAVIGPNGRFMVAYAYICNCCGVSAFRCVIRQTSTDRGATWNERLTGGRTDRVHLAVDNSEASPYFGRYYATWANHSVTPRTLTFESSSDGVAWGSPNSPSTGMFGTQDGPNVQAGPNGEVYVCWARRITTSDEPIAICFNKSLDGGATWGSASVAAASLRGQNNTLVPNTDVRATTLPMMAVDVSSGPGRGTIYIVWTNIGVPGINTGTDTDIWMVRSTDGGATFGPPTRVNDDVGTNSQWMPQISCDPTTGRLGVTYFDRREDPSNTYAQTYLALSDDGGDTWFTNPVSDGTFFPLPVPGTNSMGLHLGLALQSGVIVPAWTSNGPNTPNIRVSPSSLPPADVPTDAARPNRLALLSGAPNPFRTRTEIRFELPTTARVRLDVLDVAGRRVRSLLDEKRAAGRHSVSWDARSDEGQRLPPGVYLSSLRVGGEHRRKPVVLLGP